MSEVARPPAAESRRHWPLRLLISLALIAPALGIFVIWRSQRVIVPEVPVDQIEARVVQEIERARQAVVEDPNSGPAWGEVGLVLFANDLYAEALPWLERAEQLDPDNARWPYFRGMALMWDRPDDGLAALQRAVELAPRDGFVRLRLAEELLKAGRVEEAGSAFDAVLRVRPNDARALLGRGQVLLERGHATAAVPLLQQAADHPTAQKSARARLAEAYERLGNAVAAEQQRQLATNAGSDATWSDYDPRLQQISGFQVSLRSRLSNAKALLAAGEPASALALMRRALQERPDSGEAHATLAILLIRLNQFDEAETALQRAVELAPKLADAHFHLGGILLQRKDAAGAEARYRKVLELRPGDALAHFNVADCRLRRNDRDGALIAFKEALRFRPGLAPAHLKLGELYLEAGQWHDAQTYLEAAARLEPKNEKAQALLALARARKKPS